MAESNRTFSFFCIFLASMIWMSWLGGDAVINKIEEKISSSISIIVYLENQASGKDIQDVKKNIENNEIFHIKEFYDSKTVYETLQKDKAVSAQVELVAEDYIFPSSFELGIKELKSQKIIDTAKKIESLNNVQFVEVPAELLAGSSNMLIRAKKIGRFTGAAIFALGIILFYAGSYLYFLSQNERIMLGRSTGVRTMELAGSGARNQFFTGLVCGVLSWLIIYGIMMLLNINAEFAFPGVFVTAFCAGAVSALTYYSIVKVVRV